MRRLPVPADSLWHASIICKHGYKHCARTRTEQPVSVCEPFLPVNGRIGALWGFRASRHRRLKQFAHSSPRHLPGGSEDFGRSQLDFRRHSKARRNLTSVGVGEPCRAAVRRNEHPGSPEPTPGGNRVHSPVDASVESPGGRSRPVLGPVLPPDAVRVGQ